MGDVSTKMYNKFGCVLRIERTCNDISTFRVEREVQHRDGTSDVRKAPLKKSIYSLHQLSTILKSANYRHLEFILPEITPSAMTRIFKRLKVHGLIEKLPGTYKYLITALGKEVVAAGLTVKNLIPVPAVHFSIPVFPFTISDNVVYGIWLSLAH